MDKYKFAESEHIAGFHSTFQEHCYECYREARLIQSYKIVNRTLPYEKGELRNWHGDNYPLGYTPE